MFILFCLCPSLSEGRQSVESWLKCGNVLVEFWWNFFHYFECWDEEVVLIEVRSNQILIYDMHEFINHFFLLAIPSFLNKWTRVFCFVFNCYLDEATNQAMWHWAYSLCFGNCCKIIYQVCLNSIFFFSG